MKKILMLSLFLFSACSFKFKVPNLIPANSSEFASYEDQINALLDLNDKLAEGVFNTQQRNKKLAQEIDLLRELNKNLEANVADLDHKLSDTRWTVSRRQREIEILSAALDNANAASVSANTPLLKCSKELEARTKRASFNTTVTTLLLSSGLLLIALFYNRTR